jgi:2,3-bisphosphoglycerate-dependent phosphoglycerate mutase
MELTLIRHGQSVNNAQGDEARHHDPELTELGWNQAKSLATYFTESENTEEIVRIRAESSDRYRHHPHGFDVIYVSAMHRALQTAKPIADALDAEVKIWPDLHESGGIFLQTPEGVVCHGGLTRAEISSSFPRYVIHDAVTDAGWYNIALGEEDIYGCHARAMRVAKRLRDMADDEATRDKRIALVSHGNFLHSLLNALFDNLPAEDMYFWHYNTGFSRVDFTPTGRMIVRYVNRFDHLPAYWVT